MLFDKTIIYSIIYIATIFIIDRTKITKKYRFEPLKLLNYLVWFTLSLIAYLIPSKRIELVKFCSNTIMANFAYENILHPEDFWHSVHHYMTIITIIAGYNTAIKRNHILECVNIYYVAFLSSIFSSIRKLSKIKYGLEDIKTIITYHVYRVSYILAKGWGLHAHYNVIYNEFYNFNFYDKILAGLCFLIHLLQLFFISKIIRN